MSFSITTCFAQKFFNLFHYEEKILVYILFSCCYDYTSYIWLNLGLHPKINIQISTENYIFSKMNYFPTDLIKIIVQFIPPENYRPLISSELLHCNWRWLSEDPKITRRPYQDLLDLEYDWENFKYLLS